MFLLVTLFMAVLAVATGSLAQFFATIAFFFGIACIFGLLFAIIATVCMQNAAVRNGDDIQL